MTNAISLISEALTHAGEDQQVAERLSHLEMRRITPDTELPPMEFLFRLFGKPCFPRGELVGLTGKPKSGKTFVSSILMTLCFREEVLSIRRDAPEQLSVLWYDTEQSDESTQDILRHRIIPMLGEGLSDDECRSLMSELFGSPPPVPECPASLGLFDSLEPPEPPLPHFHIFNVRQEQWRERLPMLEASIEHYHPDLVILDGIRDLINDINDGVLAQDTVERLMYLASSQHCCIACILHQNKAAEDKNLRGWIGTELTHKAFEVYECEKDENRIFSFSQKLTRKFDIQDKLKYVVDEQGIPQIASVEAIIDNERRQRQPTVSSRPELTPEYLIGWEGKKPVINVPLLFGNALPEEQKLYAAKAMQETVMRVANVTSYNFYNSLREQALRDGIIVKTTNEDGHIAYFRPPVR